MENSWQQKMKQMNRRRWIVWASVGLAFLTAYFHRTVTGVVSGVAIAVACAKEVNPPHLTGVTVGVVNSGPFVGAAFMQPLFGWVLDQNWQGAIEQGVKIYPMIAYRHAFWFCAVILMIGLVFALLIKETRCRNVE